MGQFEAASRSKTTTSFKPQDLYHHLELEKTRQTPAQSSTNTKIPPSHILEIQKTVQPELCGYNTPVYYRKCPHALRDKRKAKCGKKFPKSASPFNAAAVSSSIQCDPRLQYSGGDTARATNAGGRLRLVRMLFYDLAQAGAHGKNEISELRVHIWLIPCQVSGSKNEKLWNFGNVLVIIPRICKESCRPQVVICEELLKVWIFNFLYVFWHFFEL